MKEVNPDHPWAKGQSASLTSLSSPFQCSVPHRALPLLCFHLTPNTYLSEIAQRDGNKCAHFICSKTEI